jgi:hypothetical protein
MRPRSENKDGISVYSREATGEEESRGGGLV